MKIETKFNVGEVVYYLSGNNIEKGKIDKITITSILNKKGDDTINITYWLVNCCYNLHQNELFKDFEEFKDFFQVKFEETNTEQK